MNAWTRDHLGGQRQEAFDGLSAFGLPQMVMCQRESVKTESHGPEIIEGGLRPKAFEGPLADGPLPESTRQWLGERFPPGLIFRGPAPGQRTSAHAGRCLTIPCFLSLRWSTTRLIPSR